MHIERVRFDRVFDVTSYGVFSFESGGAAVYDVHLREGFIPSEGMTLDVVFRTPGKWASVVAWQDPASGKIVLRETPWESMVNNAAPLARMAAGFAVAGFFIAGGWGVLGALPILAGIAIHDGMSVGRSNREAQWALLDPEARQQLDVFAAA